MHLARALPPSVVVPGIIRIGIIQTEVYAVLTNSQMNETMRKRAILTRRYGGIVPGFSPVASAQFIAAAIQFEEFVGSLNKRVISS